LQVPWGFRKLLNWLSKTYGSVDIYVTENGFADYPDTGVNDTGRVDYYTSYINEMLKAVKVDGINVKSYSAWSLLDNFEWQVLFRKRRFPQALVLVLMHINSFCTSRARGYTERFGTHYVDMDDPARPRTPKQSAVLLKKIFADNGFPQQP
jgi:beta-glucosidase/6-phospho-beta-glucosidase/beta-galactosidase